MARTTAEARRSSKVVRSGAAPGRREAAEADFAMARLLAGTGRLGEAIDAYHAGLDKDPRNTRALTELGWCYLLRVDMQGAATAAELAKRCGAGGFDLEVLHAWCELFRFGSARAHERLGRVRPLAERFTKREPARSRGWELLSEVARTEGAVDEAVACARRAVWADPSSFLAWYELSFALFEQDRKFEALDAIRRANSITRENLRALLHEGTIHRQLEQTDDAGRVFAEAVALAPDDPAAWNNLALVHQDKGEWEQALAALDASLAIEPSDGVGYNKAFSLLALGRLAEGWEAYDKGLAAGVRKPHRTPSIPPWAGEDLTGRTILVAAEQGMADEVMFAACVPDLVERAEHVVLECNPRLVSIFRRSFPTATVRFGLFGPDGEPRDVRADTFVHAGSLQRWLRPTIDSYPDRPAYLTADPGERARWRERLDALGPGPKIGIAWRSMRLHLDRLANYSTLDEWGGVIELAEQGFEFVNLQYGDRTLLEDELDALESATGVHVHRWDDIDYTYDLEAVAGLTVACDVVVNHGSFPARLAAALGVPTVLCVVGSGNSFLTLGTGREPFFPRQRVLYRRRMTPWAPVFEGAAGVVVELLDTYGTAAERA